MSAHILPRLALRQSRWSMQRRTASSTSEAVSNTANKAKEGASEAASKAQQGLSRVTSSAGSALSSASGAAGRAVSGIGGRTGRLISFVQGLVPPTVYYARVGGELLRIIVQGRGMSPPTMQTVQGYLTPLQHAIRNPSAVLSRTAQSAEAAAQTTQNAANNPQNFLAGLRNMDTATLTTVGVVAAETFGFFSIGEIIGRFKIVGYRGGHGEHH